MSSNAQQLELDRAKFLLMQALDEDEANNSQEALELYTQAVELCLQAVRKLMVCMPPLWCMTQLRDLSLFGRVLGNRRTRGEAESMALWC